MGDATQLGQLLQAWRARAHPSDTEYFGARRTPGLRREEVSLLANISADYLKRIEQGRAHPSAAVLKALGDALRLSETEFRLALQLAGHAADRYGRVPRTIPPSVHRLLDRLSDSPIAVFDAAWTRISQNDLWTVVTGDAQPLGSREANIAWRLFCGDPGRIQHQAPEDHKKTIVADLRSVAGRYPADPALTDMLNDLQATSPAFTRMWHGPTVAHHSSDSKVVIHPNLGAIELDCDVLSVHGADLRVVVFTASPRSQADEQLRALAGLLSNNHDSSPASAYRVEIRHP